MATAARTEELQSRWVIARRSLLVIPIAILVIANIWMSQRELSELTNQQQSKQDCIHGNALMASTFQKPVHVLLTLSGSHAGFLAEVEVALKSILMNAPEKASMTIHMMADGDAYSALDDFFNRTIKLGLLWKTRNQITIRTYDCSPYISKWTTKIQNLYPSKSSVAADEMEYHTIGTWFRLMANEVLPKHVEHVLYMDSDVVILANLQELWKHIIRVVDPEALFFQWGEQTSAGFIILNVRKLPDMWALVESYGLDKIREQRKNDMADQLFLQGVQIVDPTKVGRLPDTWDNTLASKLWRWKGRLVEKRQQIGYIHFNGGGPSRNAWFGSPHHLTNDYLTGPDTWQTFGIVDYYIRMPWTWAQFFMAAKVPEDEIGYNVVLDHKQVSAI